MRLFYFLLFYFFVLFTNVFGGVDFLDNAMGAKAAALGGSYVAGAADSSAIYWNSAGLTQLKGIDFGTTFYQAYEGNHFYFALAFPIQDIKLGIGYLNSSVDDINHTVADPSGSGHYLLDGTTDAYVGHSLFAAIGFPLGDDVDMGLTGKLIGESMDSYYAYGGAVDAGLLFSMFRPIHIGINFQNVWASGMRWNNSSKHRDLVPMVIRGGIRAPLLVKDLFLSTDVIYVDRTEEAVSYRSGLEYWLAPECVVRVGLNLNPTEFQQVLSSVGLGLRLDYLVLDFAWINQDKGLDNQDINDICQLTISYSFDPQEIARQKDEAARKQAEIEAMKHLIITRTRQ